MAKTTYEIIFIPQGNPRQSAELIMSFKTLAEAEDYLKRNEDDDYHIVQKTETLIK